MPIQIKRVYDPSKKTDGVRILIDRLWPRGIAKEEAKIDRWLKDVAPSTALRKWFGHDPEKWPEFKERYFRELDAHKDAVNEIRQRARTEMVTLVFGAKDARHSNAEALVEYLKRK